MLVVSVPNVVVLKPIDVHLELAVGVDVHVGNEEMCNTPSISLPPDIARQLYFIWDFKVRQRTTPTALFFYFEKHTRSFASRNRQKSQA